MAQLRLLPRDERFFELFEQAANLAFQGVEILQKLLADTDDIEKYQTAMVEIEHKGDKVIHETMEKLNRTFVTPIDPEDIRSIANCLDDIIDSTHAAVERIVLYSVIYPNPGAPKLAAILMDAVKEVQALTTHLRDFRQRDELHRHCVEINRLENEGDHIYREALGKLFRNGDMMELLRWKEIYERIEHALNHCEGLADIIGFTLIKHS